MTEPYKTFEQINFARNPYEMKTIEINSELARIMPFLKDNYGTSYCNAIIARIDQYQNELTRRNIEEGSKNAATWSKWALLIAVSSILINVVVTIVNYTFK
jgi:CHASE3 domain sensor protein